MSQEQRIHSSTSHEPPKGWHSMQRLTELAEVDAMVTSNQVFKLTGRIELEAAVMSQHLPGPGGGAQHLSAADRPGSSSSSSNPYAAFIPQRSPHQMHHTLQLQSVSANHYSPGLRQTSSRGLILTGQTPAGAIGCLWHHPETATAWWRWV